MKVVMRVVSASFWLVAVSGAATPVAAQGNGVDLGVGYQLLRSEDASFPQGFSGDVASGLTEHFAIVGEGGWSRDSLTPFGFSKRTTALHLAGGMRWNRGRDRRVRPFAQVVLGAEHERIAVEELGTDAGFGFLAQSGGGLIFRISGGQSVFSQVDLRHVFRRDSPSATAVRLLVGLRLNLR